THPRVLAIRILDAYDRVGIKLPPQQPSTQAACLRLEVVGERRSDVSWRGHRGHVLLNHPRSKGGIGNRLLPSVNLGPERIERLRFVAIRPTANHDTSPIRTGAKDVKQLRGESAVDLVDQERGVILRDHPE